MKRPTDRINVSRNFENLNLNKDSLNLHFVAKRNDFYPFNLFNVQNNVI